MRRAERFELAGSGVAPGKRETRETNRRGYCHRTTWSRCCVIASALILLALDGESAFARAASARADSLSPITRKAFNPVREDMSGRASAWAVERQQEDDRLARAWAVVSVVDDEDGLSPRLEPGGRFEIYVDESTTFAATVEGVERFGTSGAVLSGITADAEGIRGYFSFSIVDGVQGLRGRVDHGGWRYSFERGPEGFVLIRMMNLEIDRGRPMELSDDAPPFEEALRRRREQMLEGDAGATR